jgi:hypothetical protein
VCSAHDVARKDKRQTISGADVVAAMAELDFAEFTETLEACLQGIKKKKHHYFYYHYGLSSPIHCIGLCLVFEVFSVEFVAYFLWNCYNFFKSIL